MTSLLETLLSGAAGEAGAIQMVSFVKVAASSKLGVGTMTSPALGALARQCARHGLNAAAGVGSL